MAKDAYYFSHDSNARNDVRMIKLRRMGGLEAVGLYWCVIEILRESEGYELNTETIEDICFDLRINVDKFELLFICQLLIQTDTSFYSNSLKNRMIRLDEIKEKRAIAGSVGGKHKASTKQTEANAKQMLSNNSIVKQNKENNNIPTFEEFKKYALSKKPNIDEASLKFKYEAWIENGWKDGNDNKISNWKTKLLNTLPHLKESEIIIRKEKW